MPYATEHYDVTFGGTICQDEIWQCGLHFAPSSGEDIFEGAFEEISVADIYTAIGNWFVKWDAHVGPGSGIGNPCTLDWASLAVKTRNGENKYDARRHVPLTPIAATPVSPYPPQVTYVVTLWSGEKVRRANYGRFYVPLPKPPWTFTNGRMDAPYCDNLALGAKEMIHDVAGEVSTVGVQTYPAIVSRVGVGENKPIRKIAVGRVLDTQRRRRNKLVEEPVYKDF
jgi:hypothetical protein